MKRNNDISDCITGALETYFRDLDGNKLCGYKLG